MAGKAFFKSEVGELHFGIGSPERFAPCESGDAKKCLAAISRGRLKLWRCNVCNDLHVSEFPPERCPTCMAENSFVEISLKEFRAIAGI